MNFEIFLFGTGMYVIGKNTETFGTIFPAIFEFSKKNKNINLVLTVFTRTEKSKVEFLNKIKKFKDKFGLSQLTFNINIVTSSEDKIISENVRKSSAKIKCAIISLPDSIHYKYILLCSSLSLHVLTVKPFVENIQQAKELISIFEKKQLYGYVEFHKRFDTSNIFAKDVFLSGRLGLINSVIVEYSQKIKIPSKIFSKWVRETNIFQYLGVHYVDQIFFVTGALPVKVMAVSSKNKLRKTGIHVDDEIISLIEWRNNDSSFFSTIRVSWIDSNLSSAMSDQKISYYGTEGNLRLDQKNRGIELLTHNEGLESVNPYFTLQIDKANNKNFTGYGIDSINNFLVDLIKLDAGSTSLKSLSKERPVFSNALISVIVSEAVKKKSFF